MTKELVGMENLPNVYIERITVDPKVISRTPLKIQYQIKVLVKMYEHKDMHSWRNVIPGLKVKCAFISDDRATQLDNGLISLYDIPMGAIHRATAKSCDTFNMYKSEGEYKSYTTVFNLNTLQPPGNLNVYVACFIDDLNFSSDVFNKFYGPMSAEKIFVGGQLNTESGYFYYPDTNEEYGGPVHVQNGTYMEGSEHSDDPHKDLRYVAEENFKIVQASDVGLSVGLSDDVYATYEGPIIEQDLLGNREMTPGGPRREGEPVVTIEDPNIPNDPLTEIY